MVAGRNELRNFDLGIKSGSKAIQGTTAFELKWQ
jgi:hypothetical protein